ncbi:MAG: helix-turn-helix transcriptional regulator [Gammaproteobacteria bacterium]|nr:helix-turn-helix transcriptional regulator [Gammaproteobacteria bacterium]
MRTLHHPAKKSLTLSRVLYAFSDPVRLSIVKSIAAHGEQPCGTFGLSVAKSTASHHFRVLREAGVIQMRPEGTQYINSLRRDDLDSRFPGLLDAVLRATGPI